MNEKYKGDITWNVTQVFPEKLCINFYSSKECYLGYSGEVSGLKLFVSYYGTTGKLELQADGVLRGTLQTASIPAFPVEIELR